MASIMRERSTGFRAFAWAGLLMLLLFLIALTAAFIFRTKAPLARETGPAVPSIRDLGITSPLNQPGGPAPPDEAYAVYSALYQAPVGEPLAFAEDSFTDIPQVGQSCLKPENADEQVLADAFADANRQSHRWRRKFSIPQGYLLLSEQELALVQSCLAARGQNPPECEKYGNLRHVRLLGAPGFDSGQTHALVSVIKSCGRFCGSGGIFEMQRTESGWRRAPATGFTRDCSWMY